ncbi:30S ribosomal protein S18 [Candidatus Mycoplasma haematohominis]|uniref:Small ribosomal subunit protein bS18 n=1 Tax=Candidatus Mycoplasma haematohominis TaxID=1494318 RepID=A0A478FPB8_9MOLU|nr:30S ribosomal protein S18 [Candidatus Mycoplasma haemohominis]GCE63218.1 30S ribosomal protein S18 [Candidatus Mycoplasma haemohominis]
MSDDNINPVSPEASSQLGSPLKPKKRKKRTKKICWLCKWGCLHTDYKDVEFLKKRYLKNNKIVTHKITGNCLKHQHQVATAIKRARIVALLPFVED